MFATESPRARGLEWRADLTTSTQHYNHYTTKVMHLRTPDLCTNGHTRCVISNIGRAQKQFALLTWTRGPFEPKLLDSVCQLRQIENGSTLNATDLPTWNPCNQTESLQLGGPPTDRVVRRLALLRPQLLSRVARIISTRCVTQLRIGSSNSTVAKIVTHRLRHQTHHEPEMPGTERWMNMVWTKNKLLWQHQPIAIFCIKSPNRRVLLPPFLR